MGASVSKKEPPLISNPLGITPEPSDDFAIYIPEKASPRRTRPLFPVEQHGWLFVKHRKLPDTSACLYKWVAFFLSLRHSPLVLQGGDQEKRTPHSLFFTFPFSLSLPFGIFRLNPGDLVTQSLPGLPSKSPPYRGP